MSAKGQSFSLSLLDSLTFTNVSLSDEYVDIDRLQDEYRAPMTELLPQEGCGSTANL